LPRSARSLQLERLVQRFPDKLLDQGLAPGAQRAPAKSTGKPLGSGKTDTEHLVSVAIQHAHSPIAQNPGYLADFPAFVVVVSQDGNDRYGDGGQPLDQLFRFVGIAAIGQIATEGENIRMSRHLRKQHLQGWLHAPATQVDISQGGYTYSSGCSGHGRKSAELAGMLQ
jgi:hypothetical protein